MGFPAGLHVVERPATDPGSPTLVFVHGSLDRAESFRRVMRRLPELSIVIYDRRGYQGSRGAGTTGLTGHIADLVAILAEIRSRGAVSISAVGHSAGGDVVLGAALSDPGACDSVGAFEPPMPWLGFHPPPDDRERIVKDPGDEAERFFSRMVSASAWQRLSHAERAGRRADGPALVADMLSMRGDAPFNVMDLEVPAIFGMGSAASASYHRQSVIWLGSHVPGAEVYEIESGHGAHLSRPDDFATFSRRVVDRARV